MINKMLQVTLVGQFINCLMPYIEQNSLYFLISGENSLFVGDFFEIHYNTNIVKRNTERIVCNGKMYQRTNDDNNF